MDIQVRMNVCQCIIIIAYSYLLCTWAGVNLKGKEAKFFTYVNYTCISIKPYLTKFDY